MTIEELHDEMVATNQKLRAEMVVTTQELRGEIAAATQELRAEIAAATQELRTEMSATTQELRAEMVATSEKLRAEMATGFTRLEKKIRADVKAEIKREGKATRLHFDVMVEKMQESIKLVAEGTAHHTVRLDDHEKRIKRLEGPRRT